MNLRAKNRQPQWQKIAGTILVIAIALGYWYFENKKKQQTAGGNDAPFSDFQGTGIDLDDVRPGAGGGGNTNKPNSNQSANSGRNAKSVDSFFEETGRNTFRSPAGLVYTMGPRGEHRRDHVLRHGEDQPNRPVHSVFEGSELEIFQLIDEAYQMVKDKSKQVKYSDSRGNDEYTISMNRKVGYEGGRKGKDKNYPDLRKIKLVLKKGNQVITAYPYR